MTSAVADVVGVVVATVARNSLVSAGVGPRPALRVTGFAQEEVVAALDVPARSSRRTHGSTGLVIKVGTKLPIDGVSDDFILRDGETLTYWRNQAVPAILLFDWDVQRDEEGLAAINRLDDLSLLNDEDSAAGAHASSS